MASHPITSWQIDGKQWKQWQTLFSWASKSLQSIAAAMKLKDACSLEEKLWQNRQHIKRQRHYFASKGPSSQIYGFSSSHVWMWELDYKESWALKNWCFWTVMLEKTWVSLGLQGDQTSESSRKSVLNIHWRDWSKLKLQYFGHLMRRADSLEKTLILEKIEGKRRREDEMVG